MINDAYVDACKTRVSQLTSRSLKLFVSISTETVWEKHFYWHNPNRLGVTVTSESERLERNRESPWDVCRWNLKWVKPESARNCGWKLICGTVSESKQWVKMKCRRAQTTLIITLEQIEVPSKVLDYFVWSNRSEDTCQHTNIVNRFTHLQGTWLCLP